MHKLQHLLLLIVLISGASATSWSSRVSTNSSSWSIERQSTNLSILLEQSVEGTIAPIDVHGRSLGPYYSYYSDVNANDVRLRERTFASEGRFSSEGVLHLNSRCTSLWGSPTPVKVDINKPAGSPIYTIQYFEGVLEGEPEKWSVGWPVGLSALKRTSYVGQGISDREFAGNNLDYVGTNLLYNKELDADRRVQLTLRKMNATVLATNDQLLSAEFMPTKSLDYHLKTHTTGIADLSYSVRSSRFDFQRGDYPVTAQGEERYYGTYEIERRIRASSIYENSTNRDSWLPCCAGGYLGMALQDRRHYSGELIFDSPSPGAP